ncbi:MAG: hypothetical protein JWP69_2290 [Flaviaesturariibacter sp.]|nr:hypothetical protein [Flaviaesturariibacter sp.]
MTREQTSTKLLVYMIGISRRIMPYTSHMITLMVANVNIRSEISPADLVFHVLMTCGRNVIAEMLPAAMPRSWIDVIVSWFCFSRRRRVRCISSVCPARYYLYFLIVFKSFAVAGIRLIAAPPPGAIPISKFVVSSTKNLSTT